jgi:alpha-D-ribose 1-methylphosphonate 5-triphosphate synthase subunit PhnH
MQDSRLQPGFGDPVNDSQSTFRAVLDALSRPGTIHETPAPEGQVTPISPAMSAVILTLADYDTPLWLVGDLDRQDSRAYFAFHCGVPFQSGKAARFVAVRGIDNLPDLTELSLGTSEYPDRSATVVIDIDSFEPGGADVVLQGPGIKDHKQLALAGLTPAFWYMAIKNAGYYPLGLDFIFCVGNQLVALPRSTQIEVQSSAGEEG